MLFVGVDDQALPLVFDECSYCFDKKAEVLGLVGRVDTESFEFGGCSEADRGWVFNWFRMSEVALVVEVFWDVSRWFVFAVGLQLDCLLGAASVRTLIWKGIDAGISFETGTGLVRAMERKRVLLL